MKVKLTTNLYSKSSMINRSIACGITGISLLYLECYKIIKGEDSVHKLVHKKDKKDKFITVNNHLLNVTQIGDEIKETIVRNIPAYASGMLLGSSIMFGLIAKKTK